MDGLLRRFGGTTHGEQSLCKHTVGEPAHSRRINFSLQVVSAKELVLSF